MLDRLTILLNVGMSWEVKLRALLESLPARTVRLVVFDLEREQLSMVLFRQDDFHLGDLPRAAAAVDKLVQGPVDYRVLRQGVGDSELLASLVNAESRAPDPSDAVIFLSHSLFTPHRVAPAALSTLPSGPGGAPQRYFYIRYAPVVRFTCALGQPAPCPPLLSRLPMIQGADMISALVSNLKGATREVYDPPGFAAAIGAILAAI